MSTAHAGTVWLIDDVMPNDVYSSLSNSKDAFAFRKRAGGTSLAWHGDVYKLNFFIHDFMPSLRYVTISTGGNYQTLLWQRPRRDFAPLIGSMEAIDWLTYFDLLKQDKAFHLKSEDEAFAEFLASYTSPYSSYSPNLPQPPVDEPTPLAS